MSRRHVHFAAGELGDASVKSGLRTSAHIHVYLDVPKALSAGLVLWRSAVSRHTGSGPCLCPRLPYAPLSAAVCCLLPSACRPVQSEAACNLHFAVHVLTLLTRNLRFLSVQNNVILTSGLGEEGVIPMELVARAVDSRTKAVLWPESEAAASAAGGAGAVAGPAAGGGAADAAGDEAEGTEGTADGGAGEPA